jgi:ParB-like chromosome segregation protein Spo0J
VFGGAVATAVLPSLEFVVETPRRLELGLQMVPIDSIRIDWSRWRRAEYPGEQRMFATLVESIKEMGVMNPVMVEPNCDLIDGTYRVEAAKAAGLTEIPAIVREDLSALNELRETDWKLRREDS